MKDYKCIAKIVYPNKEVTFYRNSFWDLYRKSFVNISVYHDLKTRCPIVVLFNKNGDVVSNHVITIMDDHHIGLEFKPKCRLYKCVLIG